MVNKIRNIIVKDDIDFENILNRWFSIVNEQKILINNSMLKKNLAIMILK